MGSVQLGRINKTKWYFLERESFLNQLRIEIKRHIIRCKKKGFKPAIRLNGTSEKKLRSATFLSLLALTNKPVGLKVCGTNTAEH